MGVPILLRWDRGLEFAADSIAQAALALGCVSQRTDAYSPWQKGKIERLNRTIEQELLQGLPGWTGGHRDVRGRLVDQTPWTLERFVVVFADWVSAYNTRRAHTALAGRTPLEVWRSDPTPVRALEPEQARWMLLARKAHVVQKDGIQHDRDSYFADELSGMVGEEVEVGYLPTIAGGLRYSMTASGSRPLAPRSSSTRPPAPARWSVVVRMRRS